MTDEAYSNALQLAMSETLRQSARLLNEQGKILDCLHILLSLKSLNPAQDFLIPEIRSVIDPTLERFNRCLAAGDIEQAVQYADALAALLPVNVAVLNSALSCNLALRRTDQAAKYTAALVKIDPLHATTQAVRTADSPVAASQPAPKKPVAAPAFKMSPQQQQNTWLTDAICAALGPANVNMRVTDSGGRQLAGGKRK
jgi:hypothetical protein